MLPPVAPICALSVALLAAPAFDPGPAAEALPAPYARAEAMWRPFFERVLDGKAIVAALGRPDEETGLFDGSKELFWRKLPAFPGGVSVYVGPDGLCQDATFYIAPVGSVWTGASKRAASRAPSPILLDALPPRYGIPGQDLEGKGRRIGVRRIVYEAGGDATRSVTFFSLPYSPRLHYLRVSHERPAGN